MKRTKLKHVFVGVLAVLLLAVFTMACGDDDDAATQTPVSDDSPSPMESPASATPAPPDPAQARQTFQDFVGAVQQDESERAWSLYIASVPDDVNQHNQALGCDFSVFSSEFSRMRNMFDRIAPLEVDEVFSGAGGSLTIELTLIGADGNSYLATLYRDPPQTPYRLRFFNNGRAAIEPGVPDPFPSPEDPQGFCGIWNGPR